MKSVSELVGRLSARDRARLDQLLALFLGVASELQIWLSPSVPHRVVASVGALVLWGAVALRRRWPLPAVVTGCAVVSVDVLFGAALTNRVGVSMIAAVLIFYAAGAFLDRRMATVALVAGLAAVLPQILLGNHIVSNLIFELGFMAFLPWLCGRQVRTRTARARRFRELSEELDLERERRVRAAADLERLRIARELHDVVGHCLSVIALHAGGARAVLRSDPERAREAMLTVERTGQEALTEMRRLVGVFGADTDGDRLRPLPGLSDIEELVTRTRSDGLDTELTVDGTPQPVSPGLELCAYRIVQEGLTNTIKHAQAAHAKVRLSWLADRLELEVADNGRGVPSTTSGRGGHGLIGMRERAALHSGSLTVSAAPTGGYRVLASLPLAVDGLA